MIKTINDFIKVNDNNGTIKSIRCKCFLCHKNIYEEISVTIFEKDKDGNPISYGGVSYLDNNKQPEICDTCSKKIMKVLDK